MTAQQFSRLSDLEQVSTILELGHLMGQNVEDDQRVFLYRIESFYVSASYSLTDQLKEITCFLDADQATPHFRKHLISINPAEREVTGGHD